MNTNFNRRSEAASHDVDDSEPGHGSGSSIGGSFSESLAVFTYDEPVQLTMLNPSFGTTHGGTSVLVHGKHFTNTSALACKFGSTVVAATFVSHTRLLCTTPVHRAKEVAVEVTLNGHDYSFSDVRYGFEPPPVVRSISPVVGPALKGGTVVTVKGENLKRGMETHCRFGGYVRLRAKKEGENPPGEKATILMADDP